jgi:hypothetical protein
MFIYDKRNGGVTVRHIENKLGIHGSPTCELVYKNAKAELCGQTRLGLIKYVMSLMNGARLGIGAQSVGLMQAAYNEGLAYARERAQFDKKIILFPAVYDMLSRMKAKIDAGRSILYMTSRYVDIYKTLEDIARERPLTAEERAEQKKYSRLADALTPITKGMTSEFANQNAYDAIQIHGGSGFIMEYKSQRLYRDARILSIYEGTTQLQVVAALRYITNGTYSKEIEELLASEVPSSLAGAKASLAKAADALNASIEKVKSFEDQEVTDFLGRRLFQMTGMTLMGLLLLNDAARSEELFAKSARIFSGLAAETAAGHSAFISSFDPALLSDLRAE